MAGKDRSQWSEAYRRRVERAEAAGKTRQQARGHREREHVIRKQRKAAREAAAVRDAKERAAKERAQATGALTPKERAYVRRTAREVARRSLDDPDDADEMKAAADAAVSFATRTGFANWTQQLTRQRLLAAEYKAGQKDGSWIEGQYKGLLEEWSHDPDSFDDGRWYYYH